MIKGVGIDLVNTERFCVMQEEVKQKFAHKILSSAELIESRGLEGKKLALFLAKRFVLKEALSKALRIGLNQRSQSGLFLKFSSVTIQHNPDGAPFIELSDEFLLQLAQTFQSKKLFFHASLSDEKDNESGYFVTAVVLFELR